MITLHANGTIDGLAAGTIPATSIEDAYASGGLTIGGIRIQTGQITTDSTASSASSSYGVSAQKYRSMTVTGLSGFASAPNVYASLESDYHEANIATIREITTSEFKVMFSCSRDAGITSRPLNWLAIGEAS